jgi:hypothetical protein
VAAPKEVPRSRAAAMAVPVFGRFEDYRNLAFFIFGRVAPLTRY